MNNEFCEFQRTIKIRSSQCDVSSRLGVRDTMNLFQDISADHVECMGIGIPRLLAEDHACWVLLRTHICFSRRPALSETVTVMTWPQEPDRVRHERFFAIRQGDELLAEAKTQWIIMDAVKRTPRRLRTISTYPEGARYRTEMACAGPYRDFLDDFSEGELVYSGVAAFSDIDQVHHVNNTAYCRMMLDAFSGAYFKEHEIREIELYFRHECREGERYGVYRRETEEGWQMAVKKENGSTAVFAFLRTE